MVDHKQLQTHPNRPRHQQKQKPRQKQQHCQNQKQRQWPQQEPQETRQLDDQSQRLESTPMVTDDNANHQKKLRKAQKLLRQIQQLQVSAEAGQILNTLQQEKLSRRAEVEADIARYSDAQLVQSRVTVP